MNKKLLNYYYIRLYEKKNNVNDLLFLTKFMKFNNQIIKQNKINKILVNISFIIINFNKKRMAPFLLIIEILTSQRNFPIRSFKNILYLGIKKNNFVGCKITLRNKNLYEFLDNLILFFPQLNINSIILKKNLKQNKYNFFNIWITHLFNFYNIKNLQTNFIKNINFNFIFSSWFFEEKLFNLISNNINLKSLKSYK